MADSVCSATSVESVGDQAAQPAATAAIMSVSSPAAATAAIGAASASGATATASGASGVSATAVTTVTTDGASTAAAAIAVDTAVDLWSGARASLRLLAVFAVVAGLWFAEALFLPVVLAILLTLLLTPAVDIMDRLRLPRWLGALVVVVTLLAAFAGVAAQLVEPAQTWLNPKSPEWRKLESRIRDIKRPFEQIQGAQDRVASMAEGTTPQQKTQVVIEKRDLLGSVRGAQSILVGALSTLVLLYFLLASGDMFLRKLIRVLPNLREKKAAVGIARTVQIEIGRYFLTIATINLGLATLTAVAMAFLGMPSPVFWGALAGVLNFVPYAGPGVALALLTAGAFVSLDSWSSVAAVPLTFFAFVLIEGQVVQPVLVGRRLQLNVVVTFLAVLCGGWLWGLGGVVVAIPTLVVLKICADHIPSMSTIGEFVSREKEV